MAQQKSKGVNSSPDRSSTHLRDGVRMSRIQCFFLEPTDRSQVSLRRWRDTVRYLRNPDNSYKTEKRGDEEVIVKDPDYKPVCGKGNYCCDASVIIGDCLKSDRSIFVTDEMKLDPQWPSACECGYAFQPDDHWQWNENQLYKRSDNGGLVILGRAPVGAMWYADWMIGCGDNSFYPGPDGHLLCVKTPGGDWCIDQRSNNGARDKAGWVRTGKPPKVTATPSIGMGEGMKDYHGWLKDGVLESC